MVVPGATLAPPWQALNAAIVFSAVARLGAPVSGIVWRLVGWGLFAHGLWRLCVLASPKDCRRLFHIATAIVATMR